MVLSVIVQGLVESKYRFRGINGVWSGKVHEERVFSSSSLYTKGAHEILLAESQLRNINGAVVPLFVFADAAYPFLKQ